MAEEAFMARIAAEPDNKDARLVYADWLEEHKYPLDEVRYWRGEIKLLPELDGYDWYEAFGYAGGVEDGKPAYCGDREAPELAVDFQDVVSVAPFSRLDVCRVIGLSEGENDGNNWVVVGRLRDGRWFAVSAGCDYTGWG